MSHLIAIPSVQPIKDAETFQAVFVDYSVKESTTSNVTLIRQNELKGISMVIFCGAAEVGKFPSVVLVDDDLNMLLSRIEGLDQVFVTTSNAEDLDVLLFHFEGGGKLLVTSEELVMEQPDGLHKFTKWLKNPETIAIIPSNMRNSGMEDVPLLEEKVEVTYNEQTRKEHKGSSLKTNGKSIMEEKVEPIHTLPKFKTIRVSLDDGISSYPLNSRVAIPFENDLFCGKILIICKPINPEADDPYWNERIFSKKRRRIIMQIQGKFKRQPRGLLYFGGEVSEQMKLGLVGKGMSNLLLNFMRSFVKDLSYSFGNKKEVAHITAPAWFAFDSIIVTPPGDSLPALGSIEFPESKAAVAARRSSDGSGSWNTTDTFTLSFHSMYIDGPTWRLVEIPFAPSLDLRTFWDDSFFRFVLYDNDSDSRKQMLADNEYFFRVQVEHLGDDKQSNNDNSDENTESLPWQLRTRSFSQNDLDTNASYSPDRPDDGVYAPIVEELDGEEFYFYDAEEPDPSLETTQNEIVDDLQSILNSINNVCPMHVDMCMKGRYIRTFALNVNSNTIFRLSQDVLDYCNAGEMKTWNTKHWSPRLSSCEKIRRKVGQIVDLSMKSESSRVSERLNDLLSMKTQIGSNFLKGNLPNLSAKLAQMIRMSSFVARATSDHHWVEEWMKVTDKQVSFYHPERLQKANFRISLSNIISVNRLEGECAPLLPNYLFMGLQTLGRTVYLFFDNKKTRDDWVEHLSSIIATTGCLGDDTSKESNGSASLISVDNPSKEFLHKSSMWNCKQRRILNCRKFSFRNPEKHLDPIEEVQDALRKVSDYIEEPDESNLCPFLDSAASLKSVDVSILTEDERSIFFVNLYHVMIIHAFLVLGPPDSLFKWISYFNTIAYQCSDDIFALTELEHNILRAPMNYPSQFVSKFVIPKSWYRFALTRADCRLNFALNCGSDSCPSSVPIYKKETYNEQLDAYMKVYLKVVRFSISKRGKQLTITLPKVCSWFAEDFGGSLKDILQYLEPFLDDQKKTTLASFWSTEKNSYEGVSIKHLQYSFDCRNLVIDPERGDS